jgi:hypothetical protein
MSLVVPRYMSATVFYKGRPILECVNPDCHEDPGHGRWRLFCLGHAEQLAKISESVKTQGRNMHHGATDPKAKNKKRRVRQGPTCTTVGCDESRNPPLMHCSACITKMAEEDDG